MVYMHRICLEIKIDLDINEDRVEAEISSLKKYLRDHAYQHLDDWLTTLCIEKIVCKDTCEAVEVKVI